MDAKTVERVKQLLETWDIRALMLSSLLIQALLTFLAPYRKSCASGFLSFCMWLLYLSADAVALFTIGLISSSQGSHQDSDLLAFWAPFLLLHLGGPDTITALALEDNELWHRHALQLAIQVAVTLYVFVQSVRRNNSLWLPTVLMFVDGCIKYTERTSALYFASVDTFRDSIRTKPEPGPNYARFMEEFSSAARAHIPASIQGKDGPSEGNRKSQGRSLNNLEILDQSRSNCIHAVNEANAESNTTAANAAPHWYAVEESSVMVKDAYNFYNKFKGLLADAILSLKERDESRGFFLDKPAGEAFRVIEIELNFIYDIFYTKIFLLHRKRIYARIISFLSVAISLLLFSSIQKNNYRTVDIGITFALLLGAIVLDICSTLMLVSSDWWFIIISSDSRPKWLQSLLMWMTRWTRWARHSHHYRWSRIISKYNLLKLSFKDPPTFFKYIFVKGIKDALMGWLYVENEPVDAHLIANFVIEELQKKAKLATDTKTIREVCSARGNLVLQDDYFLLSEYLNPWTINVDYDESLLTWHLATDICYWTTYQNDRIINDKEKQYCQISKQLSDYMSYVILRQQALVYPVVGISEIRFEDTCAEAKKFMHDRLDTWFTDTCWKVKKFMYKMLGRKWTTTLKEQDEKRRRKGERFLEEFCRKLLEVKSDVQPIIAKGDKSKSVLFDACRLAKQLKILGEMQWEITSKVWVELLCYAAIRCSPRSHVARLSKGGELITLVWLLMTHLGLGEKFRQNQGFGWTKLIIHK